MPRPETPISKFNYKLVILLLPELYFTLVDGFEAPLFEFEIFELPFAVVLGLLGLLAGALEGLC